MTDPVTSPDTPEMSAEKRTWNTHVVFSAIARQQVIAATEEEAMQIATDEIRSRRFTESVEIIIQKAWQWRAGDR